ncbi:hypothetical protein GQ42DRAFT_154123 [Ramicandelaber brevisporus]|nr:hypothetical protein GQ42DRAFT_154123 [Ramicandelaber brevisporus]
MFGTLGQSGSTSTFGQPAGQSLFGQPAAQSTFGQPSSASAFGQPASTSTFGQPATTSTFGRPPTSGPLASAMSSGGSQLQAGQSLGATAAPGTPNLGPQDEPAVQELAQFISGGFQGGKARLSQGWQDADGTALNLIQEMQKRVNPNPTPRQQAIASKGGRYAPAGPDASGVQQPEYQPGNDGPEYIRMLIDQDIETSRDILNYSARLLVLASRLDSIELGVFSSENIPKNAMDFKRLGWIDDNGITEKGLESLPEKYKQELAAIEARRFDASEIQDLLEARTFKEDTEQIAYYITEVERHLILVNSALESEFASLSALKEDINRDLRHADAASRWLTGEDTRARVLGSLAADPAAAASATGVASTAALGAASQDPTSILNRLRQSGNVAANTINNYYSVTMAQFDSRLQQLTLVVEELERTMHSLVMQHRQGGPNITPAAVGEAVQRIHQSFIAITNRIAVLHDEMRKTGIISASVTATGAANQYNNSNTSSYGQRVPATPYTPSYRRY